METMLVGTAAHSGEGEETFSKWLINMDQCLNRLAIKYPNAVGEVILYVNGDDVDNLLLRNKIRGLIEGLSSKANLEIRIEFTSTPGKTNAAACMYDYAQGSQIPIIMTDLDVLRLCDSMEKLWESMIQNPNLTLIGSRHYVLPAEFLNSNLGNEEIFWYGVFEGDKSPNLGFPKKTKVRGGQFLLSPYGDGQALTANGGPDDQQLNNNVPRERIGIEEESLVFHLGRNSLIEHIIARTRYSDECKEEPYLPSTQGLYKFVADLKSKNLDNKTINLYLLRQY